MTTVDELYSAPEYELVVFYFKEHSIFSLDDLEKFDFSELLFVPELSADVISKAKALLDSHVLSAKGIYDAPDNSEHLSANVETQESQASDTAGIESPAESRPDGIPIQEEYIDAPVADIYQGVPRHNPFVRYCKERHKNMMSQLAEGDFTNAMGLKGLGKHSAEVLRQVWVEYTKHPTLAKSPSSDTADSPEIESVFGDLPHGAALIRYCHSKGWAKLPDMMDFSFDASEIKGLGPASMEKLHQAFLRAVAEDAVFDETVFPENISEQNFALPVTILDTLGADATMINTLKDEGIDTIQSLVERGIPRSRYIRMRDSIHLLSTPVTESFSRALRELKEAAYQSLLRKAQGDTLQAIADDMGLTRERVRQINLKTCRQLTKSAECVVMLLHAKNGQPDFSGDELSALFADPDSAACCKFVLREGSAYKYIKQADKYVASAAYNGDIVCALNQYVSDIIGNGINFYEELENIEEQLRNCHMGFFDFEDVMKYLVGNGYHFYGDYVVKGRGSYAPVCYDAILKYFPFDIKLDSDADNHDMKKLRSIIERRYSGLVLPEGNRALCARLAPIMVLSDRGRYCPAEKVIYSAALMEEIFEFIQSSSQSTFYYAELFSSYQGRLFAETNITNANFLHGVLKYLYPDDFRFERDLLIKLGAERRDVNARLCDLLSQSKSPMSKSEILAAMPGLNDFVLSFAVARLPELIQWDYGFFNHINNIRITADDKQALFAIIGKEISLFGGYLSEEMLYRRVKQDYPEFISKNSMTSSQNLYYVCAYLFGELYRFRRPHILSLDFPVAELTIESIARVLLGNRGSLNYTRFVDLAAKLGWANGTFHSVFSNLEKGYIRIDENNYVSKDLFAPSEEFLDDTAIQIGKYVAEGGYYAISSIFNYDCFPDCSMVWNSFLLQSLIEEYNLGYRIIAPQVKDRRFQRGIIVPADFPVLSFEDLVLLCMHKDGVTSFGELEMEKYLRNRGLIMKGIPQELYDCAMMPFKNDIFTIK